MLFDQLVELFELRLHDIDVTEIEIHHLAQERSFPVCVSAPESQHEALGTLRSRFGLVTSRTIFLGPFVVSSARIL